MRPVEHGLRHQEGSLGFSQVGLGLQQVGVGHICHYRLEIGLLGLQVQRGGIQLGLGGSDLFRFGEVPDRHPELGRRAGCPIGLAQRLGLAARIQQLQVVLHLGAVHAGLGQRQGGAGHFQAGLGGLQGGLRLGLLG